uniref:Small heat shock protein n=1 Tax=Solanum lycopersicum TaxID=4081 RepID=A0A5J6YH45_SOLLC|nr:small heat shock protein [Solanum lycopersicum]
MAHCLSRFPISQPILFSNNPKYSNSSLPISSRKYQGNYKKLKVMVVDFGHQPDHLQKPNKTPQPRKRTPQMAPVGLWDRFPTARTVQQMMDTMDRVIEDPLAFNGGASTDDIGYRRGRTPWEIKENEGEYKMRFDMPGMTKEDVKVWLEEKMLVVKGEKMVKNNEKEEEWSAKSYGKYNTRIALPENIDFEKIKAEVKDGVLYITIPKASSNPKVFDINVQ